MNPDPATLHARCPLCGYDLWARRGEQWTLKAAIVRLGDFGLEARCPKQGCAGIVRLPFLTMVEPPTQSLPVRRYIVRSTLDKTGGAGAR